MVDSTYHQELLVIHDYNIDFNAGDYLALRVHNNGSDPEDTAAIIWVKWRN